MCGRYAAVLFFLFFFFFSLASSTFPIYDCWPIRKENKEKEEKESDWAEVVPRSASSTTSCLPTGNQRLITSWFAFCDLSDNLSGCMHSLVASQALRHTKWLGRTLWAYSPAGRTKENELVRRARDEIASLWLCARTSSFNACCMAKSFNTRSVTRRTHS